MTGPSVPTPLPGRPALPVRDDRPGRWLVLIRVCAAMVAAALAAVVVVAGCDGPSSAAVPQPSPNAPPVAPADGGR